MNCITVNTAKKYDVIIGSGLLSHIGCYIDSFKKSDKVAIISDSNVWPLYGEMLSTSLLSHGFSVYHYVFSAGEASKVPETYFSILNFLAENTFTRSDMLLALGGGVVGDITGFVAATYLRGIDYVQIPTSLLAMVDSSVGGKTAIDLPTGKNLVGAFYQPCLVLCDINALSTLPESIFKDGCAEVIKYGILYDPVLFSHLEQNALAFDREYVISRCVELKHNVVSEDEFDTGERQKLNLGHTLGHGIEKLSNYCISHGQAVAIGMAAISKAGYLLGFCDMIVKEKVISILQSFGLPVRTPYSAAQLLEAALSDKKRSGNSVNLIIPRTIGNCTIQKVAIHQLQSIIEAGL